MDMGVRELMMDGCHLWGLRVETQGMQNWALCLWICALVDHCVCFGGCFREKVVLGSVYHFDRVWV